MGAEQVTQSSLRKVIHTYQDLNSETVDEFAHEPSPLEFMRYVARNRPFIVRGAVKRWTAFERWRFHYLKKRLAGSKILVAVTPDGRADAPQKSPVDGSWCFAKPLYQTLDFQDFLDYICRPKLEITENDTIWYAQTQNDNLRGEYAGLFEDVEPDIRWASIALGNSPDAVNMWLGTSKSLSAMHRDPYQNIFCQLVGSKHFWLIPPIEAPCVNEQFLPTATWAGSEHSLHLEMDEDTPKVPCALWDPSRPFLNRSDLSEFCRPLQILLQPGDMLYLPTMWYHQVSQIEGPEGFCCSVNYWYDMDYTGSFFPLDQLVRLQSQNDRETT